MQLANFNHKQHGKALNLLFINQDEGVWDYLRGIHLDIFYG